MTRTTTPHATTTCSATPRTTTTRPKTARTAVLVAVGAALLGLTATACTGDADATRTPRGATAGTAQGSVVRTAAHGTTPKAAPACTVHSLAYTLTRRFPEQQGDHLLITAVNTSGSACTVRRFPFVTPGGAHGHVPVAKDDEQPAQPVLVPAGGTVYSALPVFQESKAEDSSFTSLRLSLYATDAFVTLKTPGEVEYAAERADGIEVLSWNTKKPYDF
ncbi:DUF4232 domain-containing protein [Streptomyces sp. SID14478]|uniref:DUF4232 domain-containing protein n=1 Tax=Streptomyces sp. SID14478 TaxID=2706073 RepID=UPI0013DEA199|nr:DUF4232 domain-containing protein [Streptomyces sp. SID14478]NEB82462.1 DUF4232 domain-containing protein [Streptomyces sp. SID14478]